MNYQTSMHFLGFYLNRKKGLKRWLADWVNGADMALDLPAALGLRQRERIAAHRV